MIQDRKRAAVVTTRTRRLAFYTEKVGMEVRAE